MLQAIESLPDSFYWSAPLDVDSDFTAEDPLAFDYLGQQVGLWLFPGLTTRTGRAQNYAMVLYGLYLAEVACRRYYNRGLGRSEDGVLSAVGEVLGARDPGGQRRSANAGG